MIRIILLCSAGMSTSLLARKMQDEADNRGLETSIEAYGMHQIRDVIVGADIVLLSPQVSYAYDSVKEDFPGYIVGKIEMMDYGRMKADVVLDKALVLKKDEVL